MANIHKYAFFDGLSLARDQIRKYKQFDKKKLRKQTYLKSEECRKTMGEIMMNGNCAELFHFTDITLVQRRIEGKINLLPHLLFEGETCRLIIRHCYIFAQKKDE